MPTLEALEAELNSFGVSGVSSLGRPKPGGIKISSDINVATQTLMQTLFAAGYSISDAENVANMQQKVEAKIEKAFYLKINNQALANSKRFWHVYEPGHTGVTKFRLYDLQAADKKYKSTMQMQLTYRASRMLVPVPQELAKPGKTGKHVKKRHIFINVARTMEYGQPIRIAVKKAKFLAFLGKNNKIMFVKQVSIDTKKQATFGSMTRETKEFIITDARQIASQVYAAQGKKMKESALLAARRRPTVTVPTAAMARAAGKSIARSIK